MWSKITRYRISILLALFFVTHSVFAVYTEPTRRTVLNEVVQLSGAEANFPIYLSDAGDYFAEVYLTDKDGEVVNSHQQAVTLDLKIDFLRKGKLIRSETAQVEFAPGEVNKTLFTARAPLDLPQRRGMEVVVVASPLADNKTDSETASLRLQITRKFEFGPIFVR